MSDFTLKHTDDIICGNNKVDQYDNHYRIDHKFYNSIELTYGSVEDNKFQSNSSTDPVFGDSDHTKLYKYPDYDIHSANFNQEYAGPAYASYNNNDPHCQNTKIHLFSLCKIVSDAADKSTKETPICSSENLDDSKIKQPVKNKVWIFDSGIFDWFIFDFLPPSQKLYAYLGHKEGRDWIINNYKKTVDGDVETTTLCGQLNSVFGMPSKITRYLTMNCPFDKLPLADNNLEHKEEPKRQIMTEEWHCDGLLHRNDDMPAVISYKFEQCGCTNESNVSDELKYSPKRFGAYKRLWYKNGKQHRDNGLPAEIAYTFEPVSKKWVIVGKTWYQNGNIHRDDDLPAYISNNPDGSFANMIWYLHNKISRLTDNPSEIFFKNGKVRFLSWGNADNIPRPNNYADHMRFDENSDIKEISWVIDAAARNISDLPYKISFEQGKIHTKEWRKNGRNHREYGRASFMEFSENGHAIRLKWYSSGIFINETFPATVLYDL